MFRTTSERAPYVAADAAGGLQCSSLISLVKSDLYRYGGRVGARAFLHHFFRTVGFRYFFFWRLCVYLKRHRLFARTLFYPFGLILSHYSVKYGILVPILTEIGPGFYIGHHGGIVIHPQTVIGKNCNISHEVTIGVAGRGGRLGCPVIGDNVYIAPGAKVIGNVLIGNNAAIGANCVVTNDVPDNAVVVGIPGQVISYKGSTGYIKYSDYPSEWVTR